MNVGERIANSICFIVAAWLYQLQYFTVGVEILNKDIR